MEEIASNLNSPSWWFTAVVVGVVASIAAAFLKDYLERKFNFFLAWSQHQRDLRKQARQQKLDKWGGSEALLTIAYLRMIYSVVMFLGLAILVLLYVTYLRLKYNFDLTPSVLLPGQLGSTPFPRTVGLRVIPSA